MAEGISIPVRALSDYVRFGKVFWEIVQSTGVFSLPILAVDGPGVTVIARENGPRSNHIPLLGHKLRNNLVWMSSSQAFAPVVVKVLFTSSKRQYSLKEMSTFLLASPLPSSFLGAYFSLYLQASGNKIPVQQLGSHVSWPTLSITGISNSITEYDIPIQMFPVDAYPFIGRRDLHLVSWLLSQAEDAKLKLNPDPLIPGTKATEVRLSTFLSFLPPHDITDPPVDMLSRYWNQHALPGWICIPPSVVTPLLNQKMGTDIDTAVHVAAGGRRFAIPYRHIIMPISTPRKVLGIYLSLTDHVAIMHTWQSPAPELDGDDFKLYNLLRTHAFFDQWEVKIATMGDVDPEEPDDLTRNQSYLQYLHFAHTVCTGSRFFNEDPKDTGIPGDDDIIAACLSEAYAIANPKYLTPNTSYYHFELSM
ncbi:hypothetical protein HOY82DRAFT_617262 [Tuber indicum]|nr:hypothetical protein HOY82DRAFT_617262 [Tuber indicum]